MAYHAASIYLKVYVTHGYRLKFEVPAVFVVTLHQPYATGSPFKLGRSRPGQERGLVEVSDKFSNCHSIFALFSKRPEP